MDGHGLTASYSSIRRFLQRLDQSRPIPFRRLEVLPGEQAQVDFGAGAPILRPDGKRKRPHVFRVVLSFSRKAYSEVVYHQTTENFLRCLENAFWYFGGVPQTIVIGISVWSLSKLRAYLQEQGIVASISLEWLRQLLRQHKIRWRHTKTWKEPTDPQFWPKYRRLRRLYAKRPKGGRRICVDEFGPLNLQPRHGKHYARTGHVNRLRATYHRRGGVRHMFAAYDMEQDTLRLSSIHGTVCGCQAIVGPAHRWQI